MWSFISSLVCFITLIFNIFIIYRYCRGISLSDIWILNKFSKNPDWFGVIIVSIFLMIPYINLFVLLALLATNGIFNFIKFVEESHQRNKK